MTMMNDISLLYRQKVEFASFYSLDIREKSPVELNVFPAEMTNIYSCW